MKKILIDVPEIKLVGISKRTCNDYEKDSKTARITPTVLHYFNENLSLKIHHKKNPGKTFFVYTHYERDFTKDYTYFVGEEVSSFETLDYDLDPLTIPRQPYAKLTFGPGVMPDICINAWTHIWSMSSSDLGAERSYIADYELYEPFGTNGEFTLDIYIGLKASLNQHVVKELWVDDTYITPLLKAFSKFETFRVNQKTEQEKAGLIQAFEYCFELSWKMMKRLLNMRGKVANSPREAFRMAALEGFIEDPELWFDFLKKRNLTVHTYNETEVENVLSICDAFSKNLEFFLKKIDAL